LNQVFGVAPPQTLYHTRLRLPPLAPSEGFSPFESVHRNSNPYSKQKHNRSGTPDSAMHLLPRDQGTSDDVVNASRTEHSAIYNSYQHSLNSLHDILAWVR
jgi:hypothetical protein